LALASRRAGEADEATCWLERGLAACADARELYLLANQLFKEIDPAAGVAFIQRALDRFPGDPEIQRSLAELAAAAGRPDLALATCRSARSRMTNLAWACRLEAVLCLELGRPTQALEALAPIKAAVARDANAMESYVRAACAVGVEAIAEEILTSAPRDALESNGHAGAARGYLASGRINDTIRVAARIIERFPDHVAARLIHAEALALRAEAGDSAHWDAKYVQQAIEAFDWLRRRDPANCHLAQRIAWLQLEGLGAAELALQSATPLRQEPAMAHLTPEMSETLGAVLLANGQAEAAITLLTRAIDAAPTRPESYIGRAAALLRLGKSREARADLDRAAALPCSPRQDFARRRILQLLQGDS
jgi:tetratricopeptide (TPR) repeat protein